MDRLRPIFPNFPCLCIFLASQLLFSKYTSPLLRRVDASYFRKYFDLQEISKNFIFGSGEVGVACYYLNLGQKWQCISSSLQDDSWGWRITNYCFCLSLLILNLLLFTKNCAHLVPSRKCLIQCIVSFVIFPAIQPLLFIFVHMIRFYALANCRYFWCLF